MAEIPKFVRGLVRGLLPGRGDVSGSQRTISAQFQGNPLIESYSSSDVYDEKGLGREIGKIAQELKSRQDSLNEVRVKARSPKDIQDYQSWQQTQKKSWAVFEFLASLEEPYEARVARAGIELLTVREFCRYQVLHIGGELIIRDLLQQELLYAAQHGFSDSFRPYVDLQEFNFGISRVNIRINGFSLADVLDIDQRKDGSAAQYRFLADSTLVPFRRSHASVFKANKRDLFRWYPNTTKYMIEGVIAEVRAGLLSSPDVVDSEIRNNSGIPRKVAERGKQYVQRIENIQECIYRNVLNPDSSEFTPLQEAVTFYLRQETPVKLNALYILGLNRYDHIYQMYRAAKIFQEQGIQGDFYGLLADSILEYTRSGILTDGVILQQEDAYEVLEPDYVVSQSQVAVPSFGVIISSIFSKGSQRIFDDIDPSVVDSSGLSRPQAIATIFDQNRPQKFTILLHWANDLGESTEVNLNFNTKSNTFDWNFLKPPTDSDMRPMNTAALLAAQAVLVSIDADISRAYQQKQQKRNVHLTSQVGEAKQKRERVTDEVYTIRKQARQEARGSVTVARVNLSETISLLVPKRVLLPEAAELQGMLENIHSGERGNVLKAIERFNTEGVGEFTRKRAKGQGGKTLYTLRVGDTRVLVYEAEPQDGVRQFKIMDIDDRSRIYRKSKI